MRFSVVLLPEEDGRYTVTVPALPGCVTYGSTVDQALERVRDAIQQYVASLEAHEQYLAGLPGHPAPRMMITGFTAWQGRSMGVPHAVLFRAWDFQSPPPIAAEIMAAMQEG